MEFEEVVLLALDLGLVLDLASAATEIDADLKHAMKQPRKVF